MLYTGTIKRTCPVYPLPDFQPVGGHVFASHAQLEKDERVGVLAVSPATAKPTWLFVYPLDGSGAVGWIDATLLQRDALLFTDVYWQDVGGKPNWKALAATLGSGPPVFGAVLKATEGTKYVKGGLAWFKKNWRACEVAGGDRAGVSWFRGAYHFLRFDQDGAKQADYFLDVVDSAGDFHVGDFWPILDVEEGDETNPNHDDTAEEIIACARAFTNQIRRRMGASFLVGLYAGNRLRELKLTDHMGCDFMWTAQYSNALDAKRLAKITWPVAQPSASSPGLGMNPARMFGQTIWWQYGDGEGAVTETAGGAPMPRQIPGFGAVDMNVMLASATLADVRGLMVIK